MDNKTKKVIIGFPDLAHCEEINSNASMTSLDKIKDLICFKTKTLIEHDITEKYVAEYINSLFKSNKTIEDYYLKNKTGNYYDDVWNSINNAFTESISETMEKISNIFSNVSKMINENYSTLADAASKLIESINKAISGINIELDASGMNETILKWAKYGWCFTGYIPLEFSNFIPSSMDDINSKLLQIYNDKTIINMFNEVKKHDEYKLDFEESIICFNDRCYKACAMILFSIISNILISFDFYFMDKGIKPKKNKDGKDNYAKENSAIDLTKLLINVEFEKQYALFTIFKSTFISLNT